ncbi:helix-turn-helix domain-containing protein [Cohnella algarum]|uniref:helix-turn-helix domain-containing protein n=1 Tax=Cohnella algarum TaxID=2044859 RepID=UPI001968124B|nr:helix-turn-helix domain-containing protein [Cohnella algarum]MBN2981342.1 helix-turn-helix domain-containing protein [Cohnella algarum]
MSNARFDLISLQEAMDILGVSRATIDRWRKEKRLPHIKIGKEIWIDKEKLRAWVHLHSRQGNENGPKNGAERTVTVGYQSGAALLWSTLIIKKEGLFEDELRRISPSTRYRVNWLNAPNGMELVEKLIGGTVNIAAVGDYPLIAGRALSHLLPRFRPLFLAFDGKARNGGGIALVVPARRAASRPDELAGSAISTVGHSSASFRLQQWMNAHGLSTEPIVHRTMRDCLNGVLSGHVGASFMWEPYPSWAQSVGAAVSFPSDGIGGDYLTGLVADGNWADRNEDVVIAYLKAHLRAHAFMRSEPEKASAIISEASGFPHPVVAALIPRIRWDSSLYGKDLHTLNRLGDSQTGWLSAVNARESRPGFDYGMPYLQMAAEALGLPILPDAPLPGEWSDEAVY